MYLVHLHVQGDSTAPAPRGVGSEDMSMAVRTDNEAVAVGSNNIVVCVTDTGGHFGDASRWFEDAARNYAFVLQAVEQRRP